MSPSCITRKDVDHVSRMHTTPKIVCKESHQGKMLRADERSFYSPGQVAHLEDVLVTQSVKDLPRLWLHLSWFQGFHCKNCLLPSALGPRRLSEVTVTELSRIEELPETGGLK